ncbi:hypothetical protein M8C13_33055 [Crossiella sp. SN42]|uniref:hypothetical protein n=1 Tax=Crossiella sp. SN42 TaxID=2944808 RepID=UPI00207D05DF|nr:hypothetical protein [Crossiella sp. SN42]MCO1580596.1 hypothetical protein [Crossiella sp. SN42]
MEVSETLKKAWAVVQEADLPESIHEVAFREAVRLLASAGNGLAGEPRVGNHYGGRTAGQNDASIREGSNGDGVPPLTENEMYDRVAQQTDVDRNKLERIIHLDDGDPKISIAGIKLGKKNAERARAVAQILTITRGFGLGESETSLEVIRAECDRLKVYDANNFSSHMKALNGYVINGSGQNRRLRAKGPGVAAFADLVNKVLGTE